MRMVTVMKNRIILDMVIRKFEIDCLYSLNG